MTLIAYWRFALLLLAANVAWCEVRIAYPSGGSGCQIIVFPGWALPKNARERYGYPAHFCCASRYIFRHVEDSPADLLLVTVEEQWIYDSNIVASPDKYWLDLSGRQRVRHATDTNWESASPVIGIFNLRPPSHPGDNQPIEYDGQAFPKKGKTWASGDGWGGLSSSGTWLSAASLTVQKESSDGVPTRALTYVDIYHAATGKQVVALSGTLADFDMLTSKANSGWFLEDRFYVAAISENRTKMLICDLSHVMPRQK